MGNTTAVGSNIADMVAYNNTVVEAVGSSIVEWVADNNTVGLVVVDIDKQEEYRAYFPAHTAGECRGCRSCSTIRAFPQTMTSRATAAVFGLGVAGEHIGGRLRSSLGCMGHTLGQRR